MRWQPKTEGVEHHLYRNFFGWNGWKLDRVGCWMAVGDLGGHRFGGDIEPWPEAIGCGQCGSAPLNQD